MEGTEQLGFKLSVRRFCRFGARHNYHVAWRGQFVTVQAECFAEAALDEIADDGFADLARNGKAQPRSGSGDFTLGKDKNKKRGTANAASPLEYLIELLLRKQAP